jgi:hypothetical protein
MRLFCLPLVRVALSFAQEVNVFREALPLMGLGLALAHSTIESGLNRAKNSGSMPNRMAQQKTAARPETISG